MSDHPKITEVQRRRRAVVHVRQSTLHQVERNNESAAHRTRCRQRRQVEEAVFPPAQTCLNLEVDLLFFDTTSTYFECDESYPGCEHRERGCGAYGHTRSIVPTCRRSSLASASAGKASPRVWV